MDKIIAVDFDGTLCENKWPEIGEPNFRLINYIINQKNEGAKIILWTNRVNERLDEAVAWCKERGMKFDAVNENLPECVEFFGGTDSRKIYATEYIDDKNDDTFILPYHPGNIVELCLSCENQSICEWMSSYKVSQRTLNAQAWFPNITLPCKYYKEAKDA